MAGSKSRGKAALFALAALAMTAASPAPKARLLTIFQFKGVAAGEPANLRAFNCRKPRADGMIDCKPLQSSIAGIPNVPMVMTFHRDLLASMFLEVPWADFGAVEAAFVEKYGLPWTEEHPEFQGARGPVTNTVLTWRFSSGRLTLTQDAGAGEFAEAVYAEDEVPTPVLPKLDF